MVIYNTKEKSFLLNGRNYSYAMHVTESGFLKHLHYGGQISTKDVQFLIENRMGTAPKSANVNMDIAFNGMPSEYAFFGRGDFREPTAIFEREDGSAFSRLRYQSYEIQEGAPTLDGLPHARSATQTLKITLKDDFSFVEVDLYYAVCEDLNVLARHAVIRNVGKEKIRVKKAFSFNLDFPAGEYSALRLHNHGTSECAPTISPIEHGVLRLHSLRGITSHATNCFLGILQKDCTEQQGVCYGVQLCYSGSFALTAEYLAENGLRVQGGISDVNFAWRLSEGEMLTTPQTFLCYSEEGIGGMSRGVADFLRERVIAPRYVFENRPIVLNNWETTCFDFNNQKLFPMIDTAAKVGVDTFVLDDGWFGNRNSEKSGLGDWVVNEEKLEGGLKHLIDYCKRKGLRFGLWFEPEMVNEDSDLYRAHPDYAVCKIGTEPCRSRSQLVLDFTRKEVVDCVYKAVASILQTYDISYMKWDMNRSLTEYYSQSLGAEGQGEFLHRYVLGVYDLAERITRDFPHVMIENCAGGGGRFDAGMLYYSAQIWTSDTTDGYERTKIQWGTSIAYPVSAMSCHVSACPNHQTGRTTPLATRGAIASLGATGYELDLSKLSETEQQEVKTQIEDYKKIQDLVLKGDLYRLCNPFEGEWFCEMLVSKDKKKAYVVGERLRTIRCDYVHSLKLYGLAPEKTYRIQELNIAASGKGLKTAGVLLKEMREYESFTWHIEEVE